MTGFMANGLKKKDGAFTGHTHTHMHTYIYAHIRTCTHTHMHTCTHTHANHTCTHHTCTHTHLTEIDSLWSTERAAARSPQSGQIPHWQDDRHHLWMLCWSADWWGGSAADYQGVQRERGREGGKEGGMGWEEGGGSLIPRLSPKVGQPKTVRKTRQDKTMRFSSKVQNMTTGSNAAVITYSAVWWDCTHYCSGTNMVAYVNQI